MHSDVIGTFNGNIIFNYSVRTDLRIAIKNIIVHYGTKRIYLAIAMNDIIASY